MNMYFVGTKTDGVLKLFITTIVILYLLRYQTAVV